MNYVALVEMKNIIKSYQTLIQKVRTKKGKNTS